MTMQNIVFVPATKSQARLRLALSGPPKSGKTWSALSIAMGLKEKTVLLDSERGSASKYAGEVDGFGNVFQFETFVLTDFNPQNYIDVIHAAEGAGFGTIIIDSLTHAWSGKGGALEMVDEASSRYQNNRYAAWSEVTPVHMALFDAILQSPSHVIATLRSKMKYEPEYDGNGKIKKINKIGMEPIQREGSEYEFDVLGEMTMEHKMIVGGSRCSALDNKTIDKPGQQVADVLMAWLSDGVPMRLYENGSLVLPTAYQNFDLYVSEIGSPPESLEVLRSWYREMKKLTTPVPSV